MRVENMSATTRNLRQTVMYFPFSDAFETDIHITDTSLKFKKALCSSICTIILSTVYSFYTFFGKDLRKGTAIRDHGGSELVAEARLW